MYLIAMSKFDYSEGYYRDTLIPKDHVIQLTFSVDTVDQQRYVVQ